LKSGQQVKNIEGTYTLTNQNDNETSKLQEEQAKRGERAERILSTASELILRWGYRKTTIEDIARHAGIGKGTIYLHWKTREDLFLAVLLRERLIASKDLEQRLAEDPEGTTLHGMIKHILLAAIRSPLLKASMLRDSEILGQLAHNESGKKDLEDRLRLIESLLAFLRSRGLIRTDIDLHAQVQMFITIAIGFLTANQFLPDGYQISDEAIANMAAETVRRTFEVRDPAPTEQEEFSTTVGQILNQVRELTQKELET
jgi:AcrR family transcriptional regulator